MVLQPIGGQHTSRSHHARRTGGETPASESSTAMLIHPLGIEADAVHVEDDRGTFIGR